MIDDSSKKTSAVDVGTGDPRFHELISNEEFARKHAQHISDALVGSGSDETSPVLPLRPVVLEPAAKYDLEAAARCLVALINKVCWSNAQDPASLAQMVGLRLEQVPLLDAGGRRHEIDCSSLNCRFDVLLENGNARFLEANFGAADMDPVVMHQLFSLYKDLYGMEPAVHGDAASEPFEGRARLYRRLFRETGSPESVAIVTVHERDSSECLYHQSEASYLRKLGIRSERVDTSHFNHRSADGCFSIALKQFLSEYWTYINIHTPGMAAAHQNTIFLSSDSSRSFSSKMIFAWLSEGTFPLSAEEREFVERHIPWTRVTEPKEVVFRDKKVNLLTLACEHRDDLVLKPLTRCGGKGVLIGRTTNPLRWASIVGVAIESRDHVLQELVRPDVIGADYWDRAAGAVRSSPVSYVLGAYVIDGLNAGLNVRHLDRHHVAVVGAGAGAVVNVVM